MYAFKYLNLNMLYLSLTVLLARILPKETEKYKNIQNRYFFHSVVKTKQINNIRGKSVITNTEKDQ